MPGWHRQPGCRPAPRWPRWRRWPSWLVTGLALLARWALWLAWRNRLRAAPRALAAIDSAGRAFKAATLLPLVAAALALASPLPPAALAALQALAGALALAGGLWFKFTLVTRGAYNQGFALTRLPVRGVRRGQALPRRDDHG